MSDFDYSNMEKMAREYSATLSCSVKPDNTDIYQRIMLLEEQQLEILDDMLCKGMCARSLHTGSYLRNLIFRTLNILANHVGTGSYIPSVTRAKNCCYLGGYAKLADLQIDIFVLLDKLSVPFAEDANLYMLENRKGSVLALL